MNRSSGRTEPWYSRRIDLRSSVRKFGGPEVAVSLRHTCTKIVVSKQRPEEIDRHTSYTCPNGHSRPGSGEPALSLHSCSPSSASQSEMKHMKKVPYFGRALGCAQAVPGCQARAPLLLTKHSSSTSLKRTCLWTILTVMPQRFRQSAEVLAKPETKASRRHRSTRFRCVCHVIESNPLQIW